jgi:YidC/Oxa1 family membrane protein insertase
LSEVDQYFTDPATGENPDYIASRSFHGWFSFVSQPISKMLFLVMKFFHMLTNSWAWSIVLLTVVLRAVLFPINAWSMRSMRKVQKLAPLVKEIQKKHKKDSKAQQMAIMNLYRDHKANPMGGCLPMLLQIPFFIGMFDLLKSTFELRGASFIPGWIDDLAAPDVLFQWATPLPLIGNQLHLLPILLGGIMFLQSKLMAAKPVDPNNLTDQERQQNLMSSMMPLMMSVIFYNFAAGLNIYWLSSTLLSVGQQWITNRQVDAEPINGGAKTAKGGKGGKSGKVQRAVID